MKIMQFFNYLLALLLIVQCIKAKNRDGPFGELVIINAMIIPGHGGPAYGPADIIIKNDLIDQDKYNYLFTVEEVNRLVLSGVPFREAYIQVGKDVNAGEFKAVRKVNHNHEGSIGNLMTDAIRASMEKQLNSFNFEHWEKRIEKLVK